jgi:hypothetical protein
MKSSFALAAAATLLTAAVLAGPGPGSDVIIKQHAKELVNQNNVRQGVAPPTQPAQPQPATTATPPPKSPGYTRLEADLAAIRADVPVTVAQKSKIAGDIIAMAEGTKPSQAAAAKLAEDMTAAIAAKPLSAGKRSRLVQEIDAVANPSKYPQAKMQAIFDDIQAIFQVSETDRKHAMVIADDVKAIGAEVQKPPTK